MIVIIALFSCLTPFFVAQAYLDPGSGSFIIQLVVGAFLGSLVAIKMYFKNIKRSLSKLFKKEKVEEKQIEKNENEQK